jgi:hypothetical protein
MNLNVTQEIKFNPALLILSENLQTFPLEALPRFN